MAGAEGDRETGAHDGQCANECVAGSLQVVDANVAFNSLEFMFVLVFCSDVYSLCVAFPEPLADKLYFETKQFLENHVQNMLATQVAPPDRNSSERKNILMNYYKAWSEYSKGIEYLNNLYS